MSARPPKRPRYIAIEHEGTAEVHAYGGDPSALCGLDGNDPPATREVPLPPRPRIDCPQCLTLWRAWNRFKQRDFSKVPERVECPRGCGKFIARSDSHPRGVAPHNCYARRAMKHLVPTSAECRWRVVVDGAWSRWTDMVTATRTATQQGGRVEEYLGPIGDKAERAAERELARDQG